MQWFYEAANYNLNDGAERYYDDEDKEDENDDLEEVLHGVQMTAVDRARHAGHVDATDVLEQFARNARHVLVVDEKDEVVDEPVTRRLVGHVVGCFVVRLLALLLRLEGAIFLQERRQTGHLLHVSNAKFQLYAAHIT